MARLTRRTVRSDVRCHGAICTLTLLAAACGGGGGADSPAPTTPPAAATSIEQFGITWELDRTYETGQFANGDWWVVGPVQIIRITPESVDVSGRIMHGSMVNPDPAQGSLQGYDSAMYGPFANGAGQTFDNGMNVAWGVSPAQPLVLQPGSSLVSTISLDGAEASLGPQLQTAAVLTVVRDAVPAGSFRPAYSDPDKSIRYHIDQLNMSALQRVAPVGTTPDLAAVERMFERVWLDHCPNWAADHQHPTDNMPAYGREFSDAVGTAALCLNLNYTDSQKQRLLIRFVQTGIDLYATMMAGRGVSMRPPSGGNNAGRKCPIVFAGVLLGDTAMANADFVFPEDAQTFYVEETSPGVYNQGYGGYGSEHLGMPEWGNTHAVDPSLDNLDWDADPYRQCCTANSRTGIVLAMRLMGLQAVWNHQPLFDYQDRYIIEAEDRGSAAWIISWNDFHHDMWYAYRDQY